jgi:hypothetical protein
MKIVNRLKNLTVFDRLDAVKAAMDAGLWADAARLSEDLMVELNTIAYPKPSPGATTDDMRKLNEELLKPDPSDALQRPRAITPEELNAVRAWVNSNNVICEPLNTCMGFGFGVKFWLGDTIRAYGETYREREAILYINSDHLRTGRTATSSTPPSYATRRTCFEVGWEALSPFTHNPKNERLLEQFGFDPLKERDYYNY